MDRIKRRAEEWPVCNNHQQQKAKMPAAGATQTLRLFCNPLGEIAIGVIMIIYSSSGFADEKLFPYCLEILGEKPSVCIITTAAIPLKKGNKWVAFTTVYLENRKVSNIHYFDFEFDDPIKLYKYELIIIVGGNPYYLFHYVNNSNAYSILLEIAKSNKIIVGISAGALLFSSGIKYINEWNKIMEFDDSKDNSIGLDDFSGLKINDIIIFPHYDLFKKRKPILEEKLKQIELRDQISIIRLNNDNSFSIEHDKIKIL